MNEFLKRLSSMQKAVGLAIAFLLSIFTFMATPAVEPYVPATHGFTRSMVEQKTAQRDVQIANLTVAQNEKLDALGERLEDIVENQIEGQIRVLDLAIVTFQQELVELRLREKETPGDVLISRRKIDVEKEIRDREALKSPLQCELNFRRGIISICR